MFDELHIQGVNTDLDIADGSKVVWDYKSSNRSPKTAAETLDISSSSGNDVAAGTGAREITIIGTDANGNVQIEAVTQAATWRTTKEFKELIGSYVSDSGSSWVNEGDIQIYGTASGSRIGWIPANSGRTQQAFYPVKNGYRAEIIEIFIELPIGTGLASTVDYKLFKFDGEAKRELRRWRVDSTTAVTDRRIELSDSPVLINQGETWWIEAETDANNTVVVVAVKQRLIQIQR